MLLFGDALKLMRENKIAVFLSLIKKESSPAFLPTRDLRFEDNPKRKVSELMTERKTQYCPGKVLI
jgi:IMP dehydrogenase